MPSQKFDCNMSSQKSDCSKQNSYPQIRGTQPKALWKYVWSEKSESSFSDFKPVDISFIKKGRYHKYFCGNFLGCS